MIKIVYRSNIPSNIPANIGDKNFPTFIIIDVTAFASTNSDFFTILGITVFIAGPKRLIW